MTSAAIIPKEGLAGLVQAKPSFGMTMINESLASISHSTVHLCELLSGKGSVNRARRSIGHLDIVLPFSVSCPQSHSDRDCDIIVATVCISPAAPEWRCQPVFKAVSLL